LSPEFSFRGGQRALGLKGLKHTLHHTGVEGLWVAAAPYR